MPRRRVIKKQPSSNPNNKLKKINICDVGRLGNCIFRYIKAALICINDDNFKYVNYDRSWGESVREFNQYILKFNKDFYTINDYFQHEISDQDKLKIKNYILENQDHFIVTDGNTKSKKGFCYDQQKYFVKDLVLVPEGFNKFYDLVIHIRLEDKVTLGIHIDYKSILKVLDTIFKEDEFNYDNAAIVCLEPKTSFEREYLDAVKNHYKEIFGKDIKVESNSLIEDFHIIKNAKTVVCSLSTISWSACIFSEKLEKCYFPDWKLGMPCFDHGSVSFRKPIKNTISYSL